MNGEVHSSDEDAGNDVHLSTEEARAGATPHMTRYVLGWGLFLVILGFLIVVGMGQLGT